MIDRLDKEKRKTFHGGISPTRVFQLEACEHVRATKIWGSHHVFIQYDGTILDTNTSFLNPLSQPSQPCHPSHSPSSRPLQPTMPATNTNTPRQTPATPLPPSRSPPKLPGLDLALAHPPTSRPTTTTVTIPCVNAKRRCVRRRNCHNPDCGGRRDWCPFRARRWWWGRRRR